MKNKIIFSLLLIMVLTIISGCTNNEDKDLKKINCEINSSTSDDIKVDRKYIIYYKGNNVAKTESVDVVTSDDKNMIKKYSEAYQNIANQYKDIDNYDFVVKTTNKSVTSRIVVDYRKVDVDKILEIEGEEDNIFTNKKVYLDKLKEWTKAHGIDCGD